MKSFLPNVLPYVQPAPRLVRLKQLGLAVAGLAFGTLPAAAATASFTGLIDGQYTNGNNWSGLTVPNTSAGDTAIINNGSAVTYTPGGDLIIKNGGVLQITNGSYTQAGGNNYLQLNGNGTLLVNGGTFNQGTESATPFNLNGTTGNVFQITAGAANFNTSFSLNVGLTYSQLGGTVTVAAANEFDFNGGSGTLSGGVLNTRLITGTNGTGIRVFNIAGGMLNLGTSTDNRYIYAPGPTEYLNFTQNSGGAIIFAIANATVAQAQSLIASSGIEYNNTANSPLADFTIVKDATSGFVSITLAPGLAGAVPEPSSVVFAALGALGLMSWTIRRRSSARPTA